MLSVQGYILLEVYIQYFISIMEVLVKYVKTDEKIYPLSNSYLNCQKH